MWLIGLYCLSVCLVLETNHLPEKRNIEGYALKFANSAPRQKFSKLVSYTKGLKWG